MRSSNERASTDDLLDLSIGEFTALVAKAFRGAGYPWGLTEEAAFASGWLAEAGIDAAQVVLDLLEANEDAHVDGPALDSHIIDAGKWHWGSATHTQCPVRVGAAILDLGRCATLTVDGLIAPLLVAPFLSTLIVDVGAGGYVVEWHGGRCEVGASGLQLSGTDASGPTTATITSNPKLDLIDCVRKDRARLDAKTMNELTAFAHRTYAPATKASRLRGAGAAEADD